MRPLGRVAILVLAVVTLIASAEVYRRAGWVTKSTPWEDGRLSFIFIASMSAAFAGALLWIALSGDLSGLKGVARDGGTSFSLLAIAMGIIGLRDNNSKAILAAIFAAGVGLMFLAMLIWTYRLPFVDQRPVPRLVRISFAVFVVGLALAGGGLLLRAEHIFPWPLNPKSSVMFGLLFVGSAIYYAYGFVRPVWSNAYGQLAAFLVYDLVLIGPFIRHLDDVQPGHRLSLIVYLIVLVYSGLLALYYLFVSPATRLWKRRLAPIIADPHPTATGPSF